MVTNRGESPVGQPAISVQLDRSVTVQYMHVGVSTYRGPYLYIGQDDRVEGGFSSLVVALFVPRTDRNKNHLGIPRVYGMSMSILVLYPPADHAIHAGPPPSSTVTPPIFEFSKHTLILSMVWYGMI